MNDPTRRLKAIVNNTTMAIFVMDERQHCVFANQAAERLTGFNFPSCRAVHYTTSFTTSIPTEATILWKNALLTEPSPLARRCKGKKYLFNKNGGFYPVAYTASPMNDDYGKPIGTIIEARPIAEEQERRRTLETLNQVGQALAAEVDLERIVQMVTDAGVKLTGARFGAFFYNVLSEDGGKYLLYALSGAERSRFDSFGMPRATKVFAPTFLGEGVIRSDDILVDSRYGKSAPHYGMPKGHLPVRSYLAVPVVSRSAEVIGGLFFGHPEPGQFRKNHEDLIVGIAAHAAISVDNARLAVAWTVSN